MSRTLSGSEISTDSQRTGVSGSYEQKEMTCDEEVRPECELDSYKVSEYNYDLQEEREPGPVSLEHDVLSAAAFLRKISPNSGVSLYDHLSELLTKILAERPENVVDYLEEYSRNMKEYNFRSETDHLQDQNIPPQYIEIARSMMPLFQIKAPTEVTGEEDEERAEEASSLPNLMEMLFYFEQAGIGLPRTEMFSIALALHNLKKIEPIKKYRFWGKILGSERNYIIAETELTTQEYLQRNTKQEEEEEKVEGEEKKKEKDIPIAPVPSTELSEELPGEGMVKEKPPPPFPPIPVSTFQKPLPILAESCGDGINKKVYYVCNHPEEGWTMLPDVTPDQINVSRKIRKFFTGVLSTEMETYPPFPGTEMEYLRAQIARISAGTQVSPLGFYHFGGEGEGEEEAVDEEEEGPHTKYFENPNFEEIPLRDLIDESMAFWVHHSQHVLKQGRTVWWNPNKKAAEAPDEEEEEGDMGMEDDDEGQEMGPPLLTPLSEDATLESVSPWNAQASSNLMPEFAIAVLRSNLWPGAYAFATGKKFENVYIGWGQKYVSQNYSPPPMKAIQAEYPLGPEIMEMNDPTPEKEEEYRLAHLPPVVPPTEVEEEQEPEEDDAEDDDDDDDE